VVCESAHLFCVFLVRKLLNAGANPDCSNEDGLTVLHQVSAVFYSHIIAVSYHVKYWILAISRRIHHFLVAAYTRCLKEK